MFIKTKHHHSHHHIVSVVVIVGVLGYFVDVYDLILFSIIRKASLSELGLDPVVVRSITDDNYLLSGGITAVICMSIALFALYFKKESFGKDLNFVET